MATQNAPVASWQDPNTKVRSMSDLSGTELLLIPTEFPLLYMITGGKVDKPALKSLNTASGMAASDKHEWGDENIRPSAFVLGAALTNVATTINVTPVSEARHLAKGMIIEVEDEQIFVAATGSNDYGDGVTGNATIVRGYNGTTAAAHATTAEVNVVTRVHAEGTDAPTDSSITPNLYFNYTQEFTESFQGTHIAKGVQRYYGSNDLDAEEGKAIKRILQTIELGIIRSRNRVQYAGSGNAGQFGGIRMFVASENIKDMAGAALTTGVVDDMMAKMANKVGEGKAARVAFCNADTLNKLNALYGTGSVQVFRDQAEATVGTQIKFIQTNFGVLEVHAHAYYPTKRLDLLNPDYLGWGYLEENEMRVDELSKTGTSIKKMVSCAGTFEMRSQYSHAIIEKWA